MYAQLRNKTRLTRRRATKSGVFNPSTWSFKPSPERAAPTSQGVHPSEAEEALEPEEIKVPKVVPTPKGLFDDQRKPLVAIVGRPNVGKSSLFNRLVGESKSLVTPIEGTTRHDIKCANISHCFDIETFLEFE